MEGRYPPRIVLFSNKTVQACSSGPKEQDGQESREEQGCTFAFAKDLAVVCIEQRYAHTNHQGNGCQPGEQAQDDKGRTKEFSKHDQGQRSGGPDAKRVRKPRGLIGKVDQFIKAMVDQHEHTSSYTQQQGGKGKSRIGSFGAE